MTNYDSINLLSCKTIFLKILGLGYVLEIYGWESFMIFLMYGMIAIAAALIMPVITLNSTSKISFKQKKE